MADSILPPGELLRELLALSEGPSERRFLGRLLERFCEAAALPGAALYLERDGAARREAVAGEGSFPAEIPAEGGDGGFSRLDLPGARLLSTAGCEPSDLASERLVALTAGVQMMRLEKQLKRRHFEVAYRGVELEALYDVGLAIASTLELEELYEEVLLRAVSLLDARRGALYLLEGDAYALHRTFGGDARARLEADEEQVKALGAGRDPEEQDILPGARHLLAVAIAVDGRPRGMLVVGDKESRTGVGPFGSGDRRTLSLFANQAAIALENARLHRQALEKERLERELELAAEIQRGLLPPRMPEVEGFELLGWSRPARHVGGDYYDMIRLEEGAVGVLVADVSGKGMPAALLVSTLHSALRLMLDRVEAGPDLLERLNRHILDSSAANRFITFLMAQVRPGGDELTYLNAGHNPAFVVRPDGEWLALGSGGLPLGMLPGSKYEAQTTPVEPGDLVCLYSDGITEAESPAGEEFGEERLVELLRDRRRRGLAEIVHAVEREAARFVDGRPQADDQTVVLLRRT